MKKLNVNAITDDLGLATKVEKLVTFYDNDMSPNTISNRCDTSNVDVQMHLQNVELTWNMQGKPMIICTLDMYVTKQQNGDAENDLVRFIFPTQSDVVVSVSDNDTMVSDLIDELLAIAKDKNAKSYRTNVTVDKDYNHVKYSCGYYEEYDFTRDVKLF